VIWTCCIPAGQFDASLMACRCRVAGRVPDTAGGVLAAAAVVRVSTTPKKEAKAKIGRPMDRENKRGVRHWCAWTMIDSDFALNSRITLADCRVKRGKLRA